jgi:soluble lytic murein transglycosylase
VSLLPVIGKIPAKPAPGLRNCGRAGASDLLQPYFVLRNLGLTELAEQYLLDRLEATKGDATVHFALSRARSERGATTLALFDARRSFPRYAEFQISELPEEFWSLLYPRDYMKIVDRYAQEARLDLHLVLGLIRQESAFNPQARSVANARGLMQILPSTVSRTRRGRRLAARRLLEPEYNVKFGTQYLRGRLSALDGIPEQAVAAYHAGESRVKQWRSQANFQEPAEFLESIPIPSTRVYVEAVMRDAVIYRSLLDSSAQFAKCK